MPRSLDVWICECGLFHRRCYQQCRCAETGAPMPRKGFMMWILSKLWGCFSLVFFFFFYSSKVTDIKSRWFLNRKRGQFVFCFPDILMASRKRESVKLVFRRERHPLIPNNVFLSLSMCIYRLLFSIMVPDMQCLVTVWKRLFFFPCSSVCNLHCNRLKLVSCIKLCLWLNLGFSPVTPHLWMTHNKQGHQKNIVYIFIQICRAFVSNLFTALLHSSLACNESYGICTHTWQEKWLCIERKLNAKQIERISPAINLLRAELL